MPYIADPSNPGWVRLDGADAALESSWWQIPDGFVVDPSNPGWYYLEGSDVAQQSNWVHDPSIEDAVPDAFAFWSADEIVANTQCPRANVELYWPLVFAALAARGQGSMRSCAGAIGTIAIESASTFASVEEAFWLSDAARLAYYKDTSQHAVYQGGPQYHGRSLIQLTHDYNYKAAGDAIGVDLVGNPDAAMEPANASGIFAWYWASRDIQSMADREDWPAVRKAVQGGSAGLARLQQIAGALVLSAKQRGIA